MKTALTRTFVFASILLPLSACGTKNDHGGGAATAPEHPTAAALTGTWIGPCEKGQQYAFTFEADGGVSFTQARYASESCEGKATILTRKGTFSLGEWHAEQGYSDLDLVYQQWRMSVADAAAANAARACGRDDWRNGVVQDVTGRTCDGVVLSSSTHLQVVRMENGTAYFGEVQGLLSVSARADGITGRKFTRH